MIGILQPNKREKMELLLLSLSASFICIVSSARVDLTMQRDANGADVVGSVLSRMDQSNVFDSPSTSAQRNLITEQFMREMAYVESGDGEREAQTSQGGGIWGMNESLFEETQSYQYTDLFDLICERLCVDWETIGYGDLSMPLVSGLAVRIYLYHLDNTGRGLPDVALDRSRAEHWLEYFRGNLQNLFDEWFGNVSRLREIEVCRVNIDVVFVLDSSGSIGSPNYQGVRDFTYNYTENLLNGNSDSRVGIILYGDSAQVEINLDFVRENGTQALLNHIRELPYLGQYTNTPEGLCLLKSQSWRNSISTLRLAIVLTDGISNRNSTSCSNGTVDSTSNEIHELRPEITVLALVVGNNVNREELRAIASNMELIDELGSFDPDELEQNQRLRSYSACFKVIQAVPIGEILSGSAESGSYSRLQFRGTMDLGVSVQICVDEGSIVIYGSYSDSNPGPALYDFTEELDDSRCLTIQVDTSSTRARVCPMCGESNLTNRKKRQATEQEEAVTLYITIVGVKNGSRFSLNSINGSDLVDALVNGCIGPSDLCASGATVVCQEKNNNDSCECVYASGLEDLPSCKSVPDAGVPDAGHGFLAFVIVVCVVCVTGLFVMIGAVIIRLLIYRRHQISRHP